MFPLFFFNDTATTEIYTLSLHDALPISRMRARPTFKVVMVRLTESRFLRATSRNTSTSRRTTFDLVLRDVDVLREVARRNRDRKSTRLNSSHDQISYAVFCLKKKKKS